MAGKKKNSDVWNEFMFLYPRGYKGKAKPVYKCKHCTKQYAENAKTFKDHLLICDGYKNFMDTAGRDNSVTILAGRASKKQSTLIGGFKMTTQKKESLDLQSAMALYMGALAFRTFHQIHIRNFLFSLSYDTWSPPDVKSYSTTLLDKAYGNVKMAVDTTLKALVNCGTKLHFILDESTDRRSRRMINLSAILKPFGSFFLTNKDTRDAKLGAVYFLN